ncbi:methyl-accepting chemotaxis protein, partial [uncultured Xanthomonas sp.]|uniref:methyl-accepting chemotaxis protein n=1 Tax=uncultured Xanthomonas sp. TaxID=152831 RepID=UPI0031F2E2AE
RTMSEIVTSVRRVTDIMGEIAAASLEQSAGIEQVNQTITQMDEATQQNAALVEEATAAARSMEDQAGQLNQAVALFKLDTSAAVASAAPAPVRRPAPPAPAAPAATPRRPAAAPLRAVPRATASTDDGQWQEF